MRRSTSERSGIPGTEQVLHLQIFQEILKRHASLSEDSTKRPERQLPVKGNRAADRAKFRIPSQNDVAPSLPGYSESQAGQGSNCFFTGNTRRPNQLPPRTWSGVTGRPRAGETPQGRVPSPPSGWQPPRPKRPPD